MKWTVLSPNYFMSNHLGDIFGTLPSGIIAYPVDSQAKALIVDPRDVGDVAATLLMSNDASACHGRKLDISGPEEISLSQIATLYTEALGRPIKAVEISMADWKAGAMKSGFPDWLAEAVSHNWTTWGSGKMLFPTSPELLAVAPPKRTMADWIKEWAPRSPRPAQL